MYSNKIIEEIRVRAGKRTYFIDVKEASNGSKYISILESKKVEEGNFERHNIMIFEEDFEKVIKGLQLAVDKIRNSQKVAGSKMYETKAKFAKAYTPWTEADDEELTLLYCNGKNTTEISAKMERNKGAINSRIRKLELKEKYGKRN